MQSFHRVVTGAADGGQNLFVLRVFPEVEIKRVIGNLHGRFLSFSNSLPLNVLSGDSDHFFYFLLLFTLIARISCGPSSVVTFFP